MEGSRGRGSSSFLRSVLLIFPLEKFLPDAKKSFPVLAFGKGHFAQPQVKESFVEEVMLGLGQVPQEEAEIRKGILERMRVQWL